MNKLEIIAVSVEDIKLLNQVDFPIEIELCSGMDKDGYTPNYRVIKECVELSKHPIRIMIRNHNDGFYYDQADLDMMTKQIMDIIDFCEPKGFVFGCLDIENEQIDIEAMELLASAATGYSNTFHKAFDLLTDQEDIEMIKSFGINRILTQGGKENIINNRYRLKELAKLDYDFLLGGGVNLDNIEALFPITNHIHIGSAVRVEKSYQQPIDLKKMNEVIKLINLCETI